MPVHAYRQQQLQQQQQVCQGGRYQEQQTAICIVAYFGKSTSNF
jgi:hypothetical protein